MSCRYRPARHLGRARPTRDTEPTRTLAPARAVVAGRPSPRPDDVAASAERRCPLVADPSYPRADDRPDPTAGSDRARPDPDRPRRRRGRDPRAADRSRSRRPPGCSMPTARWSTSSIPPTGNLRFAHDAGIRSERSREWVRGLELAPGTGMFGRALVERGRRRHERLPERPLVPPRRPDRPRRRGHRHPLDGRRAARSPATRSSGRWARSPRARRRSTRRRSPSFARWPTTPRPPWPTRA